MASLNVAQSLDTTVHEKIAPAVTRETVIEARHEEATQIVDRHIYQDHHHVSVQPLKDKEVLPEKHVNQTEEVKRVEFHHGDDERAKNSLAQEIAGFKDVREAGDTVYTHNEGSTREEQHVHHHVHEVIQPVITKEIIQPVILHKHVPIQEIHHNEAKHHTATALPPLSISEFEKQGGALAGREVVSEKFEGEPKTEFKERAEFDANEAQKNFRDHRRSSPGSTLLKFQQSRREQEKDG